MSEPAKDEAELMEHMARAVCCSSACGDEYECDRLHFLIDAKRLLAAIRAAGWAVVPVVLMEQAADVLEAVMIKGCEEEELPIAIRAMLAAAPGVKS